MAMRNGAAGRRVRAVLVVALAGFGPVVPAACALAVEKPAPPVKPVVAKKVPIDPKSVAAVTAAVQALQKEYVAGVKEKIPKLREKSDYFPNPAPPEITSDAVMAALERPIGSDRAAEAYVKWQLLSAFPAQFPPELADRAVVVYKNAPVPAPHPGLNHSVLEGALYKAGITKKENESAINTEFHAGIDQLMVQNGPILSYRNELFGRLPSGWPAIAAGVGDLEMRVARGTAAGDFWKILASSIRGWAALGAPADQLNGLANELTQLRVTVSNDKNKVYTSVGWVDQPKYQGLQWRGDVILQPATLDEMITLLKTSATNPGGGIKFKDGK